MSRPVSLVTDPARLGPYLVERKLGAGGMGTVYLARHEHTGQIVAVKVLAPTLAREAGLVARFIREIEALEKLKNPHVVQLYDHGIDGELYYYAMEFVEGETLTARLRREKRVRWREVIDISIQICVALKAAHDAGIIHRDLKPSNLLLAPDGTVKLTDFGVAQVFAAAKLTVTGGVIGTAEYMSPEQGQGARISKRSDLYSLGAVMYVMLTGRPPFSGKTTLDVIQKHKYNQFDRPRLIVTDIPYWLDEIVCQLMEKDPDKRFADAYVVNRRLQEVLKKVESSAGDATVASGVGSVSADSSTVDVRSARGTGGTAAAGPGPGTIMRDLFRAEIDAQRVSDWRRLFENGWFLAAVLVLLVAGIGYWMASGRMAPETRFQRGVELIDSNEEANWQIVRDDYFAPLVALKSPEWDQRLQPYLNRIRLDELKSSLARRPERRGRRAAPSNEFERVLAQAQFQADVGDRAGAERSLSALVRLLAENPQYEKEHQLAEELLQELRRQRNDAQADWSFVDDALNRAASLAAQGRREDARGIWQSVVDLYASDPRADSRVDRARKGLGATAGKSSPGGK